MGLTQRPHRGKPQSKEEVTLQPNEAGEEPLPKALGMFGVRASARICFTGYGLKAALRTPRFIRLKCYKRKNLAEEWRQRNKRGQEGVRVEAWNSAWLIRVLLVSTRYTSSLLPFLCRHSSATLLLWPSRRPDKIVQQEKIPHVCSTEGTEKNSAK